MQLQVASAKNGACSHAAKKLRESRPLVLCANSGGGDSRSPKGDLPNTSAERALWTLLAHLGGQREGVAGGGGEQPQQEQQQQQQQQRAQQQ